MDSFFTEKKLPPKGEGAGKAEGDQICSINSEIKCSATPTQVDQLR